MLPGTKKNVPTSIRARWKHDESSMKQELDEQDEMKGFSGPENGDFN